MIQDLTCFISNHIILSFFWLCFLIITIFLIIQDIFYKVNIISIFQAIQLINQKQAIILDTRSIELFKKGHIVNSINISLSNIFNGNIKKLDLYKCYPIIIISIEAENLYKYVRKLHEYGFKDVYILQNGLDDWYLENLPLITKC